MSGQSGVNSPMGPAVDRLAAATADGPDALGREMAQGPAAVAETLADVARQRVELDGLIDRADRIVLVGTGASLAVIHAAAPLWRQRANGLTRKGPAVIVRESADIVLGDVDGGTFEAGDLIVAVSQSGASPETLAAAIAARTAGVPVLALTAQATSALAGAASRVIAIAGGEERDASSRSALATLAGMLALARVPWSDQSGSALVQRLRADVASWASLHGPAARLAAAERVWFVGFGAALGLAQAGALLWHEKVVLQAAASTPSEFRHGLIEAAAGPGCAVVLIEVDRPDRRRDAYLARLRTELGALGTPLVELGRTPGPGLPSVSDVPGEATVETLLRVQQLARATALAAGTYRDGFAVLRNIVLAADELLG